MDRKRRVFINRISRTDSILLKENRLKNYLKDLNKKGKITVCFSGGVDSGLLVYLCLSLNLNFETITFFNFGFTEEEYFFIKKWCKNNNIKNKLIYINSLSEDSIRLNKKDRCYFCKKNIFNKIKKEFSLLIEGTNCTDLKGYRPGIKAIKELEVISPYLDCGIEKKDIIDICRKYGLSFLNLKSRSCLFTRFDYNYFIYFYLIDKIRKIENIFLILKIFDFRIRFLVDKIVVQISFTEYNKVIKFYFFLKVKMEEFFKFKNVNFIFSSQISGYWDKLRGIKL